MTVQTHIPAFSELTYQRPNIDDLEQRFFGVLERFGGAETPAAALRAVSDLNAVRSKLNTAYTICYIRHSIDSKDEFYDAENTWYDENLPRTGTWASSFYRTLLDSPHRPALTDEFGPQLFRIAEASLKTFDESIIPLLQEENKLVSNYNRLKAGAELELDGETYNLSNILTKELDPDRAQRRRAAGAKWGFYAAHEAEIDGIFDELVRVRTSIARQLGFTDFTGLGYARMKRTDYGPAEAAGYREAIRKYFVPLAQKAYEKQRERLQLDRLTIYDEEFRFPQGNPKPQGDPQWIIARAREMYDELSDETGAFFRLLQEKELMDVLAKDGKATGGYCTFIPEPGVPFIFANFNGTSGDIDVLTHEFGHAFQVYSSRKVEPEEYIWPTYEAAEIHSMSMEFFAYPWMENFFGDRTAEYKKYHLGGTVRFLPYGVAVDEFQHRIYAEPDLSPAQRRAVWSEIEAAYLPQRDNDGNTFLDGGGFWHKQSHIFASPFYYIDYTLAQVCAFQFWQRDQKDHASAWADYLRLCRAGGSKSFLGLVELAGLNSPFAEATVREVAAVVKDAMRE
ncbi:MAG: M3 family oligoendopeptidase [Saprospiraceae bacterium]